jgi:hypothetical protein
MKRKNNSNAEEIFAIPTEIPKKRKLEDSEEPRENENQSIQSDNMEISINFEELELTEDQLNKLLEENPEVAPFDEKELRKVSMLFLSLLYYILPYYPNT